MTEQSLEVQGSIRMHSFAEVCAEIFQARLSGSLRVSRDAQKVVVYFEEGHAVFAVSNARSARLFEILLKMAVVPARTISSITNFANDGELAAALREKTAISEGALRQGLQLQAESIIKDVLTWDDGEWSFSPLVRVRETMRVELDTVEFLLEYARKLPASRPAAKFSDAGENLVRRAVHPDEKKLTAGEAFMLYRVDTAPRRIEDIIPSNGSDPASSLQILYTLWLGGYVARRDLQAAFPEEKIAAMQAARLDRIKISNAAKPKTTPRPQLTKTEQIAAANLSVDEFLVRIESAATYYDTLGLERTARPETIRQTYFSLVKAFHPDRFHKENKQLLQRIQHAFTEVSAAYEALKNPESRLAYDKKIDTEKLKREQRIAEGGPAESGVRELQKERAAEDFRTGVDLLEDGDPESAIPYLARAVHYDPHIAGYHAFYGRALSFDETQRHKAEHSFQTAIKIDGDKPEYRLMLAEFFVQVNLHKRAEGEINRLLTAFPDNKQALTLLDRLRKK